MAHSMDRRFADQQRADAANFWTCPRCNAPNMHFRIACRSCELARPETNAGAEPRA